MVERIKCDRCEGEGGYSGKTCSVCNGQGIVPPLTPSEIRAVLISAGNPIRKKAIPVPKPPIIK